MREQTDEMKGTTNRVIVDWRATPRGADLKPAIVIKDSKGKPIKVARGGDARYLLPVDAILSVEPRRGGEGGRRAGAYPDRRRRKSGDITGGLPRVAELFEARRPKDHAIIAEISGTVEFGKDYKNKQRITIKPDDENAGAGRVPDPARQEPGGATRRPHRDAATSSTTAIPAPHDILAIKGVEELANYLINEIQDVYRLQGVTINDKHIEVIVRQMLQKVEIDGYRRDGPDQGRAARPDRVRRDQRWHREGRQAAGDGQARCCSASPRRRCRRARSSRRPRSRRPRAC